MALRRIRADALMAGRMPALPGEAGRLMYDGGMWHSRDYLPHFEGGERPQFITFRLKDSLPQEVFEQWRIELEGAGGEAELRRRVEAHLDAGYGRAHLRVVQVASLVEDALLHFDGRRYRLAAWVVMPNHVHLLLTPLSGYTLSSIMHSLKSYTAREANKLLRREGKFWQEEYFDRYVRDDKHYAQTVKYIEANPVKAGLCLLPEDWPYSSARKRRERGHPCPP